MFEYLTGLITMVSPDFIVVDVNGVGYRVAVANPYATKKTINRPSRSLFTKRSKKTPLPSLGSQPRPKSACSPS